MASRNYSLTLTPHAYSWTVQLWRQATVCVFYDTVPPKLILSLMTTLYCSVNLPPSCRVLRTVCIITFSVSNPS